MSVIPPEWAPHKAIWTAFPSDAALWEEDLAPAQNEVAAMVRALAAADRMRVLAAGTKAYRAALAAVGDVAEVIETPFGDIWLRDTGPIFGPNATAHRFRFNGWGGKYDLPGDDTVGDAVAALAGTTVTRHPFILEGGAIEMDGQGTVLTTRQCLLNPNRNPGWDEASAEVELKRALGATKVLWLDEGLQNDHTDGHIDNLARFVAPGVVVCQTPRGADDPNADVLDEIALTLAAMTDATGRKLKVVTIPSPGALWNDEGEAIPASHMNFLIGNDTVVVPIYSDSGDDALRALAPLFPGRRVLGLSSTAILTGGGSFHCITQQEPA
ncbi:MAG: agmatine deiminase family protein [Caulobacterales bacterium]|jgi:agmatine deiminase